MNRLKLTLQANGISNKELAKRARISHWHVSRLIHGVGRPTERTLDAFWQAITDALQQRHDEDLRARAAVGQRTAQSLLATRPHVDVHPKKDAPVRDVSSGVREEITQKAVWFRDLCKRRLLPADDASRRSGQSTKKH